MDVMVISTIGVLVIVAVTAFAPRVGVAAPLLLVAAGVAIGFLPFVPEVDVDPEWILAGLLPPLLYSSAVNMPTMDFRRDFRTISAFSVILVVVSALVVGYTIHFLVPDVGLATGIALGAIVSPTDAVATAIVRKSGVSPRVVTVLEGESLLNDASALVLLRSAVAATAGAVSLWGVAGDFVFAVVVAVAIGFAVGRVNLLVRSKLSEAPASVAVSFVVPFVAFAPAEHLGASGLVAAVTAGLVTGHGSPRYLRAEDRINERIVWRTIEMLLEGTVFLVMGVELYALVEDVRDQHGSLWLALGLGGVTALLVLAVRAAFITVSLWLLARRARRGPVVREKLEEIRADLDRGTFRKPADGADERVHDAYRKRLRHARIRTSQRISDIDYLTQQALGPREGVVLLWAGMRGAVTLAAAQSLPPDTTQRSVLILVAFVVAAGTLIVQGGTLRRLVRRLGLADAGNGAPDDDRELRRHLADLARARLDDPSLRRADGSAYSPDVVARVSERVGARADEIPEDAGTHAEVAELRDLFADLIDNERRELLRLRDVGTYSSQALARALRRLDSVQIGMQVRASQDDD
ncbi:sodium:proton antiporter [Rhodococcus sp. HNM0569]|uniref:cation:proton antiporter n=1 Tax=Rhodococcus sp. HNM0569 TaxID=2716340 RepID=UPI00146A1218|nr:sodium:proton antiporter [Rhodococcus sp. HNM0569]NLU83495.1 sodium:proton antiporter [Rhodococcus sp. HNM0569]